MEGIRENDCDEASAPPSPASAKPMQHARARYNVHVQEGRKE